MTININNSVSINHTLGHHNNTLCKAANILGVNVSVVSKACHGVYASCKGMHLELLDKTSGNVESLASEIRRLHAENKRFARNAELEYCYRLAGHLSTELKPTLQRIKELEKGEL